MGTGGPGAMGQAVMKMLPTALASDLRTQRSLAEEQWQRNRGREEQYEGFLERARRMILEGAEKGSRVLEDEAQRLRGIASGMVEDQRARSDEMVRERLAGTKEGIRGVSEVQEEIRERMKGAGARVEEMVKEGLRIGDQAAKDLEKAVSEFQDRSAQDASAMALEIRSGVEREIARLRESQGGRMLTAEEIAAEEKRLRYEGAKQAQAALTPILSRFNSDLLQAKGALAQFREGIGRMRIEGAEILGRQFDRDLQAFTRILAGEEMKEAMRSGDVATIQRATENVREAAALKIRLEEMSSDLVKARIQLENAAKLAAVQMEMEGLSNLAEMTRRNPKSVVSEFQTLLGLYGVMASAGGTTGFGGGGGSRLGGSSGASWASGADLFGRMLGRGSPLGGRPPEWSQSARGQGPSPVRSRVKKGPTLPRSPKPPWARSGGGSGGANMRAGSGGFWTSE